MHMMFTTNSFNIVSLFCNSMLINTI